MNDCNQWSWRKIFIPGYVLEASLTEEQKWLGADQRSELSFSFLLSTALMVRFYLFILEILLPFITFKFYTFFVLATLGSSAHFF